VVANVGFRFLIRPRLKTGVVLNASPWVRFLDRDKSIDGASVGRWKATLKVPRTDTPSTPIAKADWLTETDLMTLVRDDDWVEVSIIRNGRRSYMEGMIDAVTVVDDYDPSSGVHTRSWIIEGRDWSKCMTDTQIRLCAIFVDSREMDYSVFGTKMSEAAMQFTKPPPDSNVDSGEGALIEAAWEGFHEIVDYTVKYHDTVPLPRMPGFIDVALFEQLIRKAAEGAALATRAADTKSDRPEDRPFRFLLEMMLWRMWLDSDKGRGYVLDKLSWNRFGLPAVVGCPWQLLQIVQQQVVTPHSVLNQFGNLAFNELFYEYDYGDDKGESVAPAIVYRPRPYDYDAWKKLHVIDGSEGIVGTNFSRAGDERFTYWRPLSVIAGLNGIDLMVDTKTGHLPIIDRFDLDHHGVRPAEPADDFYPPTDKVTDEVLEWFRDRIIQFRSWYKMCPEMLTGTVTYKPARSDIRIGQMLKVPYRWIFRDAYGERATDTVIGYVVGVSDNITVNESGVVQSSTTVRLTRIQPPKGLRVIPIWSWSREAAESGQTK
jgi:hypothetical protein